MWEALDSFDKVLVHIRIDELRQEAAMRRLVRQARAPRRSLLSAITSRLRSRRDSTD